MSNHRFLSAAILPSVVFVAACGRVEPDVGLPETSNSDWPSYNSTVSGTRYSQLNEINTGTVTQLRQVCSYTLPEVSALQTGMIVVKGVMYFTTDTISYAVDAVTCAEKWKSVRHSETPSALGVNRGFAYWNGKLFRGTSDVHVIALDAQTGKQVWDRQLDVKGPGVSVPMAPIAFDGLIYIGNAGGDIATVTGHVYALNANDGQVVWKFDAVPATGPARETWRNPRLPPSGAAFWTSFTLDPQNRILYVPAGNPAPDFDVELRKGDNLYSNSVIALDSRTGQLMAYTQLVKHDAHDWDVDSPPALISTKSGRAIVASANKDGLLSILDRTKLMRGLNIGDPAVAMPLLSQTPTTTRTNVDVPLSRERSTRFCPGVQGGNEWNGAAYSRETNLIYTGTVDWCANVQLKRDTISVPAPTQGYWFGAETPMDKLMDPPDMARGWVTAFNADDGTVVWKHQTPKPVLAAITPTAGGLVFAADLGGTLYAFDASTGAIIWRTDTGLANGGGLITYRTGDRQFLALASGMKSPIWPGGSSQNRILVFGLH